MDYLIIAALTLLFYLIATARVRPASGFAVFAVTLLITNQVGSSQFLASYANPALAALILLLLISLTLERSPLLDMLADHLLKGSEQRAKLKIISAGAVLSAFLNNTAVVASFLGHLSTQKKFSPSRLLLPLSYASVVGGVTTLVGTSTNLVVNSFTVEYGLPELTLFQFAYVGLPTALVCLIVTLISSRYLPIKHTPVDEGKDHYFLAAEISHTSELTGKSIEQNGMRHLDGLYLLEIERQGHLISPVSPNEVLQAKDILLFTGEVDKVQIIQRFHGLELSGESAKEVLNSNLVEVVISHASELANKTLQDVDFRTMFNAGVVGIRRGEKRLKGQLGRIPLKAGDSLLLAVGQDFAQHKNLDRNFHILSDSLQQPILTPLQSLFAFGGFISALIAAGMGAISLFNAMALLLTLFIITGLLSGAEIRRRMPLDVFIIIGSALVIAKGMTQSGAAQLIADSVLFLFAGFGVYAAFVGVYLLTLLLTETVTNNAAAALAFPIALSTAHAFNADPTPFIMAVAYGASACFINPFGYQTHTMVFSPGRYTFTDFAKTGLPVTLAYSTVVLLLTPLVFAF